MTPGKVTVELDEDLVRLARSRARSADKSDSEIVADAVAIALGFAALEDAHAQGGLPEDEADRLAVEELRTYRASRHSAA